MAPGPTQIIIILLVILLLFGSRKLPELSKSLGKSLSSFKAGKEEGLRELEAAKKLEPETSEEEEKTTSDT